MTVWNVVFRCRKKHRTIAICMRSNIYVLVTQFRAYAPEYHSILKWLIVLMSASSSSSSSLCISAQFCPIRIRTYGTIFLVHYTQAAHSHTHTHSLHTKGMFQYMELSKPVKKHTFQSTVIQYSIHQFDFIYHFNSVVRRKKNTEFYSIFFV